MSAPDIGFLNVEKKTFFQVLSWSSKRVKFITICTIAAETPLQDAIDNDYSLNSVFESLIGTVLSIIYGINKLKTKSVQFVDL